MKRQGFIQGYSGPQSSINAPEISNDPTCTRWSNAGLRSGQPVKVAKMMEIEISAEQKIFFEAREKIRQNIIRAMVVNV